MRATLKRWRAPAALLAAAGCLVTPAAAVAQCLPLLCNFTEKGKKGPFLAKSVTEKSLSEADRAIGEGELSGALSAAGSINRGEFWGNGLRMPATEAALLEMLQRLGTNWTYRSPGDLKVRVVASSQFAPQAHPDKVIVVPLGTLMRARTDDQVAWLMAHEYSHIALGHFSREAKARKLKRATQSVVDMIQKGVQASQTNIAMAGTEVKLDIRESAEAQALSGNIYLRARTLGDILALTNQFFSRTQEDQADVLGLDLALAASYNDGGASDALNEYSRTEAASANLFKSIADDMTQYGKITATLSLNNAKEMTDVASAGKGFLDGFLDNLRTIALEKTMEFYNKAHRPTDKRREGIQTYLRNAHKGREPQAESTAWITRVRATPEFKGASTLVNSVEGAQKALNAGDIEQSVELLKPAFQTPYATTPYLANMAAEIYWRAGRLSEADHQFTIAERLAGNAAGAAAKAPARKGKAKAKPAPTPKQDLVAGEDKYFEQSQPGFHRHIALLSEMKSYSKALKVIDLASQRFGDEYAFLPAKIRIHVAMRQTEAIVTAMNKCGEAQDEALRRQCDEAIISPTQAAQLALLSPVERAKISDQRTKLAGAAQSKNFWSRLTDGLKPSAD